MSWFRRKKKVIDEGLPKQEGFYLDSRNLDSASYLGKVELPIYKGYREFIYGKDGELLDVTTKDHPIPPEDRIEIH